MKFEIDWTFYFHATHPQTRNRLLERLKEAIGTYLQGTQIDPDSQDQDLYRVQTRSSLQAADPQAAQTAIERTTHRIAAAWITRGPASGAKWEYGGTTGAGTIRIKGVDSATFIATMSQS